jgi:hypothetical protein
MLGKFRRFINDQSLKEMPLHGRHFTWSNQHATPTLVKLDRVLYTVDWKEHFPGCLHQSMVSNDFDHCPLLLGLNDNYSGTRRFHFEAFWPKMQGFQEAVALGWNLVPAGPCPFAVIDAKIKATTRGLQSWNDKSVDHVNTQLALAWEVLHQLEIANDGHVLSSEEVWLKNGLKKHSLAPTSVNWMIARL